MTHVVVLFWSGGVRCLREGWVLAVMWESKSFNDNGRFGCWMKEHSKDVLRLNFKQKETSVEQRRQSAWRRAQTIITIQIPGGGERKVEKGAWVVP